MSKLVCAHALIFVVAAALPAGSCRADTYPVAIIDTITLHDAQRQRDIPLRVYYPVGAHHVPLILFSHGYGGDRTGYTYLGEGWAKAGYAVILPTHHGGDRVAAMAGGFASLFRGEPVVTGSQLEANAGDISFIVSSLGEIVHQAPQLKGVIDEKRIGVAGHSMGAGTALILDGEKVPGTAVRMEDPRPQAFVAISPQGMYSSADAHNWDAIVRPTMTIYGSNDTGVQHEPASWRREPFDHMPPGDKYNVIIDGANHFSFADEAKSAHVAALLSRGQTRPIGQVHEYVVQATLVFWNAYLKNDKAARAALHSGGQLVSNDPLGTLSAK